MVAMSAQSKHLLSVLCALMAIAARADVALPVDGYQLSDARAQAVAGGLKIDFGTADAWPNIA